MVSIRRAVASDAQRLGTLGAMLMRTHYAFDPKRFLAAGAQAAQGYANFLESQLDDEESVVFVAERDMRIIGYVYAGLEPMSWKELRGPAAFIHDVMIDEEAQGSGAGTALIDAAIAWARERGAARVMLWTAERNTKAQRLFERTGFRRTMIEMTKEL
jgi:GNAT superfamily N-acetyltransferase